ncbi:hypothetical protein E1301_Tti020882 [Triplophysa tibetana]|uniref:Ig-like domain-containing protein n=1 Tax=Triplophysa tibetana TaxID=1572043 RepID=A0A5A9NRP2_9TELE|nr:hypothetical protein E1301_Tti020882 [Triplophysa tibetana]
MSVSHDVSVSWYKGKSLLSSISVSEHSIIRSISLHLECLDDSDVYSCVINNSISTQTQDLNTDVCHKCSGHLHILAQNPITKATQDSGKSSESQNGLTEEIRSINSSSTSEDEESSKCLNEKQQHCEDALIYNWTEYEYEFACRFFVALVIGKYVENRDDWMCVENRKNFFKRRTEVFSADKRGR